VTRGEDRVLYSTSSYEYLRDSMCAAGGFECGVIVRKTFPDGEFYRRIVTDCDRRDVILLGGTISDHDTLELYDLACGLVKYGARRLTMVIPYYGYSTMERAAKEGEVVTAKTRARLLSSVPTAAMGNRVFMVDLHVSATSHYFEGGVRPVHVYAKSLVLDAARRLGGDDFVLGCTDAGRAKWVQSLADDLGVTPAFVYKRRVDAERTEVTGVSAHVKDRPVVVYDDMIRTGGSLLGAVEAYHEAGAASVAAVATHGLFPADSLSRIEATGSLSKIVCTDTHPNARELESEFLEVVSVAPLLVDSLGEDS
jgi:ribose-phosphate pyrophosphokinase